MPSMQTPSFPLDIVAQGRLIAQLELACDALRKLHKAAWRVVPDQAPFDMTQVFYELTYALDDVERLLQRIDPDRKLTRTHPEEDEACR